MKGVIRKTLGLTAGLLAFVPASAFASVASVESGIPRLQAQANEVNEVTVGELPGPSAATKTVAFTDAVPIQVQGNCFHPNPNSSRIVHCVVPASTTLARIAVEDEDDRLEPASVNAPTTIRFSSEGGTGNDVLIGTVNRDVLDGNAGHDNIFGRGGNDGLEGAAGNDDMFGEAGDDTLDGGSGNDDLRGGPGIDWLSGGTGSDNLNTADDAPGDHADCGENLGDDDLALFNPGDLVANCERLIVTP